jgi:DNA-binding GntR family transcriptional regulator
MKQERTAMVAAASQAVLDEAPARSLTSRVYGQLRADILSCRIPPDEKLRIAALGERFGVSMSAVREALSRLSSDGLVLAEDQRGFRVSPVSDDDLRDLTTVRIDIEQIALRRSIEDGDVAWEAAILAAHHKLSRFDPRSSSASSAEAGATTEAGAEVHQAFHDALVAACQSRWLLHFRQTLSQQMERYRRLSVQTASGKKRDLNKEHRELMDAVLARDADRACELIDAHFATTTRNLLGKRATGG